MRSSPSSLNQPLQTEIWEADFGTNSYLSLLFVSCARIFCYSLWGEWGVPGAPFIVTRIIGEEKFFFLLLSLTLWLGSCKLD